MKIPYRKFAEYQPVNLERLRPKDSYANLIAKRTHNLDELFKKFGKIPNQLLIYRNCPNCNSTKYKLELKKDHLKIVKCRQCYLVYTNPVFDEEHYKKTYQSTEYQNIVKNLGEISHLYRKKRFGQERVKIMLQFLNTTSKKINYLDIGCSTGFVLEAAKEAGWNATGIELNPSAVAFGKKRGLNIFPGDLFSIRGLKKRSFEAISLFDVLEHLINPRKVITRVLELLKKSGIVFLYLPNYDSASRFLMGSAAHFIWPSHHLNYFTPETIINFLESFNLRVEFLTTEGLDIADYLWYQKEVKKEKTKPLEAIADLLQFFINAGGYGKNLRVLAKKIK